MDWSTESIFASFLVSSVGFGFFLYGKKQMRVPQLLVGLVLMISPYFAPNATWMLAVGGGLVGGLWLVVRAGL